MSDLTDADRLAMLEARVTELERRLVEPPAYSLPEGPGLPAEWAVIR